MSEQRSRVCQQENLLFPRNLILPPASRFNARFVIRILFFYTLFVYSLPFCPPFRSLFWYWLYIKSPAHHSPLRLIWVDVTVQPFAHLTYICCRYIDMYECMRVCVLVTCYHKFALMLAGRNSTHDPVRLHARRLTWQVNMILHHFAVALHGSGVRDDTYFSGEIIQFSLSAFIFAVLSHLIRRPCFSGGLSKPPLC